MEEIIVACLLLLIAAGLLLIAIFSFMEKGFLFNNAYLYASPEERERMDKKPWYRQSAWVFLGLAFAFLLLAAALLLKWEWMYFLTGVLMAATVVYAVISWVRIEKKQKG